MPVDRWTWLPIAAGLAVAEAVEPFAPDVRLKWPNDALVPQAEGSWAKLAGVLVETRLPRFAVAGIGVNVGTPQPALPTGSASLAAPGPAPHKRVVEARLLAAFERRFADLEAGEVEKVRADWEARSHTLGREVEVGGLRGRAVRLADDGGLVLEAGGKEIVARVGDATAR